MTMKQASRPMAVLDGATIPEPSLQPMHRTTEVGLPAIPRGLQGVVVADTEVGDVRGGEGFYHYRQHSAIDLALERPFEDVWRLLVDGALPATLAERQGFQAEVRPWRVLPAGVADVLPAVARVEPADGGPAHRALAGGLGRGLRPLVDLQPEERRADALFLCAVTPTLLCALHRLRAGLEPIEPAPELGWAEDYLRMLTGAPARPEHVRAIEQYLVATIDHGFNASTFTARVVASTGADLGACIVAAMGALSGPRHGGTPSRALALLDEIGGPDVLDLADPVGRIDAVVRPKIEGGERIMGFGHAVYRTDDPRSLMLRDVARGLGGRQAELGRLVERRVVELLQELKPGRDLRTNVEFYAGIVMDALRRAAVDVHADVRRQPGHRLVRQRARAGRRRQDHPPERPLRRAASASAGTGAGLSLSGPRATPARPAAAGRTPRRGGTPRRWPRARPG